MSLKIFHIVFISISAALGLFLLLWGYQNSTLLTGFGMLLLVALIPYFFWFQKKMKGLPMLLFPFLVSSKVWACPVCFGDPNSLMNRATKSGVLFLVVVVALVLATIGGVAFSWSRRARAR